jgi:hypothetical protein
MTTHELGDDGKDVLAHVMGEPNKIDRYRYVDIVAEELWNGIGYRNFDGVDNPFTEAAAKTDAGDPEYRLAGYVRSVRELARRAIAVMP